MSMIAKNSSGVEIPKLEAGVYTAVSSAMIDIGVQENETYKKKQRKFVLVWTILNEQIEINGEMQDRRITKTYTFSLHEKSALTHDLEAWRGQKFTTEELNGFNVLKVLNVPCQLQILVEEKNGKPYNNIAGIMSLPKGTKIDSNIEAYHFDFEEESTWVNYSKIPKWIKDVMKKANNYESSGVKSYAELVDNMQESEGTTVNPDVIKPIAPDDDLPF